MTNLAIQGAEHNCPGEEETMCELITMLVWAWQVLSSQPCVLENHSAPRYVQHAEGEGE